jgi:hypothetical protein
MQKIKDVLRLHLLGGVDSCRQLARAVGPLGKEGQKIGLS